MCALQRHLTVSQSSDFPVPQPQARGKRTRSHRRITVTTRTRVIGVLFAILFSFAPAFAQITVQGRADDPSSLKQEDHPSSITVEFQMTQADIDRLLASVDEVIAFDSKFTGLRAHSTVERKMTSRDEIKQLMTKRMQDPENAERVQRST